MHNDSCTYNCTCEYGNYRTDCISTEQPKCASCDDHFRLTNTTCEEKEKCPAGKGTVGYGATDNEQTDCQPCSDSNPYTWNGGNNRETCINHIGCSNTTEFFVYSNSSRDVCSTCQANAESVGNFNTTCTCKSGTELVSGICTPTYCPGDFNNDSKIDALDLSPFVRAYQAVNCADTPCIGDFNDDNVVDGNDVSSFVSAYDNGICPT